jgi:hypothetical protein
MSEPSRSKSGPMSARSETIRDEIRLSIATAAGDRGWNDTRQSWLSRAASRLGLTYSRTRKLWYGIGRPYADELEEIRARITEQKWQQRRHEERQHVVADQIQTLDGGNTTPLEHSTSRGERAGDAAITGPAARPDQEA